MPEPAESDRATASGFDPGWCFVLAGLALLAASVLVPAWRDVEQLQSRVHALQHRVGHARNRDRTGREVLEALTAGDPDTHRRMVAWQWNLVPIGDEALIRERHDGGLISWVEARTPEPDPVPLPADRSTLEQLLSGPVRPWMMAAGGLSLLVGVVVLPFTRAQPEASAPQTPLT